MIKNYFKIAWRNLKKNRLYAFINIIGLTAGIVSCLLIGVYIKHELSYDRFNQNADKIVRVTMDYNFGGESQKVAMTGTKVGPQFKREFPQVVDFVRIFKRTRIIGYKNQLFEEKNFLYAEPSLFKLFSFKLLNGDPVTALNTNEKIIITQTAAQKYFGPENPIGKILKVGDKNYVVSALAADSPSNSQIRFDFVVPFSVLDAAKTEAYDSANYLTYLLLKSKDDIAPLQKQITAYMQKVDRDELKVTGSQHLTFSIEPLTSVHLHSNIPDGLEPGGSMMYIYILVVVAVLILVIAGVNYVNLSIAQSAGRGAEIGIRKVLGAAKQQLFKQFIGESMLVTAIALLFAIGVSFLLLPFFNQISGKQFNFTALLDPAILVCLAILGIVIGFLAGAYPALLLSNIKLAKILKSGFSFTSGQGVRRSLIIFQFVISIFLVITTVVILQQLSYIRTKDLGYNKSNVIVLPVDYKTVPQVDAIKKVIGNIPGVESVAAANNEPVDVQWGDAIHTKDGKNLTVNALPMDEDFIKTMQLKIVAGTDFNRTDLLQMDTANKYKNYRYSFMLNESAARALGWTPEQAIGKEISKNFPGRIKAVVKDFNFKSFHDAIGPLLIFLDHEQTQAMFVRVAGNNTPSALQAIQKIWKDRVPYRPFEYKFLDEDYDALYRSEQRTARVFTTFSIIAILLACLGLFAVTAYAVLQRTKEIGIRKVLGANVSTIIMLLSKDFLWMVMLAAVISSPIAWYMSYKWLQDFAYRISIHWWVFIAAGAASLIVAWITVGIQALKAALMNPVKSLRSE
ncbi:ABC transporter permease [Mucilaginibacter gotjawali]|uniref:Macrolide export ATP-binding/permease protein MacB n=2 Tax=Mucilaginibacter gotjawali TaxID=1550579 RepID=A0A0X8X2B9_9SPHI|nr:ABC transporter permease [Mucilaginibacter gotjawali]MBB3055676.1 putative ABC transport system permease protein [Mucilaginibacter gotjawali]BAU54495.1 Macrolide export ATP-binding/permease protein MacB [Mucilaginibacter gotjawali]